MKETLQKNRFKKGDKKTGADSEIRTYLLAYMTGGWVVICDRPQNQKRRG